MEVFMQIMGILGAALLLLAYFNNSSKKWTSNNLSYQMANLFGAILICVSSFHFSVYGPLILNFFWALIAMNGIKAYYSKSSRIKE